MKEAALTGLRRDEADTTRWHVWIDHKEKKKVHTES